MADQDMMFGEMFFGDDFDISEYIKQQRMEMGAMPEFQGPPLPSPQEMIEQIPMEIDYNVPEGALPYHPPSPIGMKMPNFVPEQMPQIPAMPEYDYSMGEQLMHGLGQMAQKGGQMAEKGKAGLMDFLGGLKMPELYREQLGFNPDGSPAMDDSGNQITQRQKVGFRSPFKFQNPFTFGEAMASEKVSKEPWEWDAESKGGY